MTAPAKASLDHFISSLLVLLDKEKGSNVLTDFIMNYEPIMVGNPLLTERDKKIILTTTSITRHTTYKTTRRPKKNRDPDWDLLIGNIVGATYGATHSTAEAITTALATGIAENR